jgi:hypothetical protein
MRNAPAVDEAITALDAGDAGAATTLLQTYLSTGECEAGNIGTPDGVRTKHNAGYDLGLALFRVAEQFGRRFGEEESFGEAGPTPEEEAKLAQRRDQMPSSLSGATRSIARSASCGSRRPTPRCPSTCERAPTTWPAISSS